MHSICFPQATRYLLGVPRSNPHELNLRNLDMTATVAVLRDFGVSEVVARRIFARVHRDGSTSLDNVAGLKADARKALQAAVVWPDLEVVERRQSDDGFTKYLFALADGRTIESVRIPLPDAQDARDLKVRRRQGLAASLEALPTAKYTLCVSSQVGCALACDFCATGRLGGIRNLETWEILAQQRLVAADADKPIRGVVFMGMGEPFLNYENVVRAGRVFCDPAGPAIAAKAITISTAGVVPMIRRYTEEAHNFRLVFSLGAPTSDLRAQLMPIENRWPLPVLMDAIRGYAASTTQRITFAYVAVGGVNLSVQTAQALVDLTQGLKIKVNLIDVTDPEGKYHPPSEDELRAFRDVLASHGIPTVRRYSGGKEIGAACGTLAATQQGGQVVPLRLAGH